MSRKLLNVRLVRIKTQNWIAEVKIMTLIVLSTSSIKQGEGSSLRKNEGHRQGIFVSLNLTNMQMLKNILFIALGSITKSDMKSLTFKETKLRIQYVALWNQKSSQHSAWSMVLLE